MTIHNTYYNQIKKTDPSLSGDSTLEAFQALDTKIRNEAVKLWVFLAGTALFLWGLSKFIARK